MSEANPNPFYRRIEGILFPATFKPECVREVINYKPTPDDVFIVTYPKCGTTWMQVITLHIFRKGKELEDHNLLHTFCPFIDLKGLDAIKNMPRPGAFKTHLPYTHVPYSPQAKYIYVLRNPKDCCVSLYYHTKRMQANHGYEETTFDEFIEEFIAGEVLYNDYFDHLMSWYPHLHDTEVFFTKYEDMKKDTRDVVLKVAAFLGKEYIDAIEKDNNVLNNILRFSGFDYMKENFDKTFRPKRNLMKDEGKDVDNSLEGKKTEFMRKGIVGDWANHLSDEQSERLNKKFTERTKGSEIYDMYKSYMAL